LELSGGVVDCGVSFCVDPTNYFERKDRTMTMPTQSITPLHQSNKSELWKKRLADFERSNLSVTRFCQSIGCSVPSFYEWKKKLEQRPAQPAFLQVQTSDQRSTTVEVRLPNGISIFVPIQAIDSLPHILGQVA